MSATLSHMIVLSLFGFIGGFTIAALLYTLGFTFAFVLDWLSRQWWRF